MIKRYVNNQSGYSLLLTIFAVLFISIIGVSILSFTLNTTRVTVNEQVNQSSYYIAEAGLVEKRAELNVLAGAAYKEVLSSYNALPPEEQIDYDLETVFYSRVQSMINERLTFESASTYEEQQSVTPFSNAKVTQISTSPLVYEIASAGTIPAEKTPELTKELKQRVEIQMNVDKTPKSVTIPNDSGTTKFQACFSVYAKGDVNVGNGTLIGPIYSDGTTNLNGGQAKIIGNVYSKGNININGGTNTMIDGDVFTEQQVDPHSKVTGNVFENFNLDAVQMDCVQRAPDLPSVQNSFPAPQSGYDDQNSANGVLKLIKDDYYFEEISTKNNRPLTIDLQGQNKRIFVDTLDLKGSIELINPGKLELIILNEFQSGGQGSINNNNDTDVLTIRYAGSEIFKYSGNDPLNGHLYIKEADLQLTNGKQVTGDIFAYGVSSLDIKGGQATNDRLIIAPNSTFILGSNTTINGNVVVKNFITNGNNMTVNPPDSDYGEWDGPGGEEQVEVIEYSEDGSFLKTEVLVEE
ncbi:hypothetical protein [Jeotgalibacillus haloalkalitolerans]|uniref:Type 4 fimbrial biogenesis protein PilX N-terminal domain-containing protein n=1 Tax=Jeotgalibacillus haloalkalitolerans TaxID=3104292 RepID=A0ABU5KHV5_9BACL|nr:hypothetical protein [Jeotgalibacillus sp. HH7-29]MDZ5710729.1 hypothetical protein [Jeotgalibacillus sp. HH7-29]